jgi:hypothetical protein
MECEKSHSVFLSKGRSPKKEWATMAIIILFVGLLLAQATPSPDTTASPACATPDRAAIVTHPVAPEYPEQLMQLDTGVR